MPRVVPAVPVRPPSPGAGRPARRARATPPARRARWRAAAVVAAATALGGCTSAVGVTAAPFADDPVCAEVILALPDELADAPRSDTTSQGTAAWTDGDPRDAIVLRCGVEPLPPTTDQCVAATDATGTTIDWVTVAGDEEAGTPWTFTTYGREPAVQVLVPTSVTSARSTSFLVDLSRAVAHAEQTRRCL
jgi:hypothetical protein